MNKVEKAILETLAFFDIFSRPLTLDELWHFLYKTRAGKLQVLIGLKKLAKKGEILQKKVNLSHLPKSYYYLTSNRTIFKEFQERQAISRKRWHKVKRIVRFLKMVPFVLNISVINSLSFDASKENSDIDILIIARKNRLWTARALTVLFLEILGQNKNRWYQADKFCLGFAFDETQLNLEELRLNPPTGGDIYFSYWLANLTPIFDKKVYSELFKNNPWIFEELPNFEPKIVNSNSRKPSFLEKIIAGKFGNKLEKFLSDIQIKRIWQDPINWREGGSVVTTNHMLKLHPFDRRREYQNQWQSKLIGKS